MINFFLIPLNESVKAKLSRVHELGGGWAWVLINDLLPMCCGNDDRYSSARVGGLCVGIFSSLQGWLCVRVLCTLQCAKNSVGSGGKVMLV